MGSTKEKIYLEQETGALRYLGVYYATKKQDKAIFNIIKKEITTVVDVLKRKRISDLITAYVIKIVLLPKIEYQMQNTFLTDIQCNILSSLYFKIFKHKVPMAQTVPNVIVSIPRSYNIKSVKDLQQIAHTSCLINCLNNPSTLGRVTCIRLKHFQINNWIPENILTALSLGKTDCRNNLLAKILIMTKKEKLQIVSNHWQHVFDWEGGTVAIKHFLDNEDIYRSNRKSMRDKRIMYINQIYDRANDRILNWYLISKITNSPPRGRIPNWYKQCVGRFKDR